LGGAAAFAGAVPFGATAAFRDAAALEVLLAAFPVCAVLELLEVVDLELVPVAFAGVVGGVGIMTVLMAEV
jgi:hypothetical protein